MPEEQQDVQVEKGNSELDKLRKQNQMLQQRVQYLTQMVNQVEPQRQQQQTQPQRQQATEEEREMKFQLPPDFKEMSDREVLEWTVETVLGEVDRRLKPLQENTQRTQQEIEQNKYRQQIQEAAQKYPDFWQYSNDIMEIAQRVGGNITAEQAYVLAKSQRTGLSQEQVRRNEKEEEPEQEEVTEEQDEIKEFAERRRQQGGEKPTQGGEKERGRFTQKEAIVQAMEEMGL